MTANIAARGCAWPAAHVPEGASIYVSNRTLTTADPELAWAWLIRPEQWSRFYGNARRIRHRSGPWPELALGSRFSWVTFGAPVTTEITEFEPFKRLAWTGTAPGATAHHAWLLDASGPKREIVTEETQRGFLPGCSGRRCGRRCYASTRAGSTSSPGSPRAEKCRGDRFQTLGQDRSGDDLDRPGRPADDPGRGLPGPGHDGPRCPDCQRRASVDAAGIATVSERPGVDGQLLRSGSRSADSVRRRTRRSFRAQARLRDRGDAVHARLAGCALSTSGGMLIAFRVIQGIGGAVMSSLTLALISSGLSTGGQERSDRSCGQRSAASRSPAGASSAAAARGLSRSSIFWVNVPIGVLAIAISL